MSDFLANALRDLEITRIFDAPRELVWKAWTDPQIVMRWWGVKGFTSPACKIDLRLGGRYFYCMKSPDGQEFWSGGEYKEIVAPEKIVSVLFYTDGKGKVDFSDMEVRDVVTFEPVGNGQTKLVFKRSAWDEGEDEGMIEIFDKLAAELAELAKA